MKKPDWKKKSRIRETKHLSTDADSSTTAKKLLSILFIFPRHRQGAFMVDFGFWAKKN